MTLIRRIPRILRRSWTRYLGLTVLVALGSVALVTLYLVAGTLQLSFDQLQADGRVEDARAWLISDPPDLASLAAEFNCDLEMRTSLDLTYKSGVTLRLFDNGDRVDRPFILEGQDLEGDAGILLNPAFAAANGLGIGDFLPLAGLQWRINGFCSLPDYIYPTRNETDMMTDANHFGIAVISKRAMQSLAVNTLADGLAVDRSVAIRILPQTAGDGRNKIIPEGFRQALETRYGLIRWLERDDNERINMVKGEIGGLKQITSILPTVIFLINCMLMATILWRAIRLEYRPIGTLRALGLGRGEIMRHYLALPLIISATGAGIGTIAGLLLARPILGFYAAFFNLPFDQTRTNLPLLLASILIPVILLLLTAAAVVSRALRQTPVSLMRGFRHRPKAMRLERHLHFHRIRFETKYRIRQSVRSGGKLLAAFLGVTSATLLLLMGFMVQNSYDYLLKEGFRETYRYSWQYVFKTEQTINPYGGEPYQLLFGRVQTGNETVMVQGVTETGQLLRLHDSQNRSTDLSRPAISRVLANKLKLTAGDSLVWIDERDNRAYTLTIGSLTEVYTGNTIYMSLAACNRMFGKPVGSFIGIFSAASLPIPTGELYMTQAMDDVIQSFDAYAGLLKAALLGLGLLSGLMATLILYILIALLIEENSQAIAMLRILGYEAREIRLLLLRTFDLPVLLGFAAGVPLLYGLYGQILESSFQEIDMAMPLRLSPGYVLAGFVLIVGVYLLARWRAGRKISQVAMAGALKTMQE